MNERFCVTYAQSCDDEQGLHLRSSMYDFLGKCFTVCVYVC